MTAPRPRLEPLPLKVRYFRSSQQIPGIPSEVAETLDRVAQHYAFRANDYYLDLIDWNDPADPIRRLIIPEEAELEHGGRLDVSDEAANTVVRGVQHKYADTALVLAASTCAAYCRYCFRKRLFMRHNEETARDFEPAFDYVARHREICDVLLTGGDPLVLPTARLRTIMRRFAAVPHVGTIRIGSKTPAFNPERITDDDGLLDLIDETVGTGTAVYLVAHFDHPRELTELAQNAIWAVQEAGAHVINQCPLIKGVNDDPLVLAELFETATALGMPQYYLFQCRPTTGNEPYRVPLAEGFEIFDRARKRGSGLSRRVRYVMSHTTGKIEVVGLDQRYFYLRYHRARDPEQDGKMVICHRDDSAAWFDDLEVV